MLESAPTGSSGFEKRSKRLHFAAFLARRIWLPKPLYAALPYFYMTVGTLALTATIYISDWFWIVPHYVLFSAACLHMGLLISRRRRRRPHDQD